ncbi:MAG: hypothetical protein ACKD6N_04910 [Candidatus Bathyarchaeota archaeon]
MSLAVYFAGRVIVGEKAKFTRSLLLTLVGVVIISLFAIFTITLLGRVIGFILTMIIWLWLIRYFFNTGWLAALGVAVLSVFMFIVILLILGFILGLTGLLTLTYQPGGLHLPWI